MTLSIDIQDNTTVTLIRCYTPTLNAPETEIEAFYHQLYNVISKLPYKNKFIIMGDFNSHVGNDHQTWLGVLGSHGVGAMNSNGLRLLLLCREYDLTITNTVYQ